MKIGVLGTGWIVMTVTPALKGIPEAECYAIASRTKERAEAAAKEYGYEKAYGSYEELVADPAVEFVYVATPHSRHYEDMMLCIRHGKHVICEKAFTLNARQAKEVQEAAKQAVENDVHIVGVSSLAAGHLTLVPQIIAELKKLGREDIIVVVGGVIPAQDYEELYQDGAAAIFGPGTPIAKSSIKMLELLMEE